MPFPTGLQQAMLIHAAGSLSCAGQMPAIGGLGKSQVVIPQLDPNGRWYLASSSWNVPIPAGATIHPNNANFILGFKYVLGLTTTGETASVRVDGSTTNPFTSGKPLFSVATQSVPAVGISFPSDPLATIRVNYPADNIQGHAGPPDIVIPLSASFAVQPSSPIPENSATVAVPGGDEYNFFKISKPGDPLELSDKWVFTTPDATKWTAAIASQISPGWIGTGYAPGQASRENKTTNGAGLIRKRDFDNRVNIGGAWDHALALVGGAISNGVGTIPSNVNPFPTGVGDNNAGRMKNQFCLPYSCRIQLDPSINVTRLNENGTFVGSGQGNMSEWKKQLLRALQIFGAYPVDSNSNPGAPAGFEETGWSFIGQWPDTSWGLGSSPGTYESTTADLFPASLYSSLRVLDWTNSVNYT